MAQKVIQLLLWGIFFFSQFVLSNALMTAYGKEGYLLISLGHVALGLYWLPHLVTRLARRFGWYKPDKEPIPHGLQSLGWLFFPIICSFIGFPNFGAAVFLAYLLLGIVYLAHLLASLIGKLLWNHKLS